MPPSLPQRSWTAEDVLEAIRSTAESGEKLSPARKDWGLFSNAVKHFGSWRKATLAAGCEPPQRSWTKELVIKAVQERHRRDLPVNSLIYKQDPSLAATANSYFGSWRAALVAAGIRQKQVPRLKSSARQVQIAARLDTLEQTIGSKQS